MESLKSNLLENRFGSLLLLFAILPVFAFGWVGYNFMSEYLRSDQTEKVGWVADAKHGQLAMVLIRANERSKLFLSNLSAQCGGHTTRLDQVCASKLINSYLVSEGALGATLYGKGRLDITIGASAVRDEKDLKLKSGQLAKLSGTGIGNTRAYFVPVAEQSSGLQLAVTYPSSNLQPVFDHPAELGDTGEAFLVDAEGYFVTKPRYPSTQGRSSSITALPMQACLSGKSSEMIDRDYRGAEVIHGFRLVPEIGSGCIMAHIDRAEALAPLSTLERKSVAVLLIFLLPIVLAALYVARRIARTEELLRASENKFRILFESANDCLMVLDLNGYIQDINQIGHERLGYTKAEMVGKNIGQFDPPEFAAKVPARFAEIHDKGQVMFEAAHVRKDGSVMPIEINTRVVELDGRLQVFSVVRDITERRRMENDLREREARYRAAIETSADGFWITDMEGRFVEVNDAYVRRSGYSRDELLNMSIIDVEANEHPEETADHIGRIFRDGQDRFESYHRTKDGHIWPVEITVSYWPIGGGRLFVFSRDITQRKQVEEAILASERRYHRLFDNLLDGFILFKLAIKDGKPQDMVFIEVNDVFKKITGWDEVIGKTGREVISGIRESNPELFEISCRVVQGGKPERFETYLQQLRKWLIVSVYSPEPEHVVFLFDDITERKRSEQMLSNRFDSLTRQANDIILLSDKQGKLIDVNDRAFEAYGYTAKEFSTMNVAALRATEFTPPFEERQDELIKKGALRFDAVHRRKDGSYFPVEVSARLIGIEQEIFIQAIVRDISERKKAQQVLFEKERDLSEAQRLAKIGSWTWDAVTGKVQWSEELYRIFGYDPKLPLPSYEEHLSLYTPTSRILFEVAVEQARNAEQVSEFDLELDMQDGARRWVFARYEPVHDILGHVTGVRGIVQDISERKHQEELLRASSREIADLYNHAPCGYHSLDKDGFFVSINDTELSWLGYRRSELVKKRRLVDLLAPESIPIFNESFPRLKERGRSRDIELGLVRKDGSVLPALISATAIRDKSGNFLMSRSMVYDMTERKKMEEEREQHTRRLQKLSQHIVAVQELERRWLASELHDRSGANLAALSLNYKHIADKLPPQVLEEVKDVMEDTRALLADATANIRDVCANLRPAVLDRAGFWPALAGYAQQFSRRTGIAMHLDQVDGEPDFPPNVKSTLFRIAQEALTNSAKHAQATEIRIGLGQDGNHTVLTISDNGRGFDPTELKQSGHASGLGLITMQERAEFIGGVFSYETAPGRGVHIRVELMDNQNVQPASRLPESTYEQGGTHHESAHTSRG